MANEGAMWQVRRGLPPLQGPDEKRNIMIRIQKFKFNSFEEHCYLLWREDAGECVIIDPGFDTEEDWKNLSGTIRERALRPVAALLTHAHPDHTYGVHRLCESFDIPVYMNKGEEVTVGALPALCRNIGHAVTEDFSARIISVEDGDHILITDEGVKLQKEGEDGAGQSAAGTGGEESRGLDLKVLFTPGHSAGGVCYLCREIAPKSFS